MRDRHSYLGQVSLNLGEGHSYPEGSSGCQAPLITETPQLVGLSGEESHFVAEENSSEGMLTGLG